MTECTITGSFDSSFFLPADPVKQELFFGVGVSGRVGEFATQLGRNALVITDAGVLSAGHPQKIVSSLKEVGINTFLYDGAIENPTVSSIQACARNVEALGIDLIIGVGGGSSLDTAKGVNFILTNGGSMRDYWGVGKANYPLLPMIAIPTTAGTGSECQSYALISDDQTYRKMACGDSGALPKVTLLDPELTLSQPSAVCAATGMDALSHCLESIVCTRSNEWSEHHARKGFYLLVQNLEIVWKDPQNLNARSAVLLGAAHAGAAIERSMLGAAHALANPLTAQKGIVHGQAVGLTLPAVLAYNRADPNTEKKYADLTRGSGIANPDTSDMDAVDLLIEKIIQIRTILNLPSRLNEAGCESSELGELAKDASEQWTVTFNPLPVNESKLLRIYQSINSYAR